MPKKNKKTFNFSNLTNELENIFNYLIIVENMKKLTAPNINAVTRYLEIWNSIGPIVDFFSDNINLVNSDPELNIILSYYCFANPQLIAEHVNRFYGAGILDDLRDFNLFKRIVKIKPQLKQIKDYTYVTVYKTLLKFYIKLAYKTQEFFEICASKSNIPFEKKYNIETYMQARIASNKSISFGLNWCTKIDESNLDSLAENVQQIETN